MSANKRVLFIEHDHVSEGGPVWAQFSKRGYDISRFNIVSELHFNQPNVSVVWPDLLAFDIVVVMGSPWGVWEDERIGNWLLPELKLIKEVHNSGIPILGICFGGQLMARVLGGSVARGPKAELGWYTIDSNDPTLISPGPWFQYHWDRWTTPPGAVEIAKTELANQAFTFGRTLALQFHPEMDSHVLDLWLEMDGGSEEVEGEGMSIEALREETRRQEEHSNKRAYDLVDQFLDRIAGAPVQPVD
ncbi:MAG TPA: type 1 glutamine amidotransferase [Candidatus Paceibacterota bacterium]|nr:type 1 glutamine amidotransferase [Candidatus Paceibacterota bacterium]